MKTFFLLMALVQAQGEGTSPCRVKDSKIKSDVGAAFSLKEICRVEGRMSLLRDGISGEEPLRKLGVWRQKKIRVIAHGGMTYYHLGGCYSLAMPFSSGDKKRILLLDKQGKVVEDVEWR